MADEKDKRPDNNNLGKERQLPDLHDRKIKEGFNKAEERNYSDKSNPTNKTEYISKPKITAENPPAEDKK